MKLSTPQYSDPTAKTKNKIFDIATKSINLPSNVWGYGRAIMNEVTNIRTHSCPLSQLISLDVDLSLVSSNFRANCNFLQLYIRLSSSL